MTSKCNYVCYVHINVNIQDKKTSFPDQEILSLSKSFEVWMLDENGPDTIFVNSYKVKN